MNFNTKKYIIKSINIFIDSTFIFAHFRASGVSPESIHIEFKNLLNSIEPGKSIDDKTFILDLKVIINNKRIINLELQISNERNWPDRSLGYLCRSYDNLNKGDDYIETKPAVHISFVNFTLFKNAPEFCAKYMLLNTKNHRIFTTKFSLVVVVLNNTELATDEDRKYGIDKWAKLFNLYRKEGPTKWEDAL